MQGFIVEEPNNESKIVTTNSLQYTTQQQRPVGFTFRNEQIPLVDGWVPDPQDFIFKQVKGAIILPVAQFYGITDDSEIDYFLLAIRQRCYNSDTMRPHIVHYLNYFLKYFDPGHELLSYYYKMKYFMDYVDEYDVRAFTIDINKYILGDLNRSNVYFMNDYNYSLNLEYYKNNKNPNLQYSDKHGRILMEISILMDMVIPLVTHYIRKKSKIYNTTNLMLNIFDLIINKFSSDADFYSKLYETSSSNSKRSTENHPRLWAKQNIRGENEITHSMNTIDNIILQIIPKYVYNQNLVCYNYKVVLKNLNCKVIEVPYEYQFRPLSNSKKDDENGAGEFDKVEAYTIKQDEALYVQNKVNAMYTMKLVEKKFGPFDEKELDFYRERLSEGVGGTAINKFQKNLIFNLFSSYFGDPQSTQPIKSEDYIKLVIASKKLLLASGLIVLPFIISGKVKRLVTRKNINKKELISIESDPLWPLVMEKYRNEKIKKFVLENIAVILASEFEAIDYNNEMGIDGTVLNIQNKLIMSEILMYVLII